MEVGSVGAAVDGDSDAGRVGNDVVVRVSPVVESVAFVGGVGKGDGAAEGGSGLGLAVDSGGTHLRTVGHSTDGVGGGYEVGGPGDVLCGNGNLNAVAAFQGGGVNVVGPVLDFVTGLRSGGEGDGGLVGSVGGGGGHGTHQGIVDIGGHGELGALEDGGEGGVVAIDSDAEVIGSAGIVGAGLFAGELNKLVAGVGGGSEGEGATELLVAGDLDSTHNLVVDIGGDVYYNIEII